MFVYKIASDNEYFIEDFDFQEESEVLFKKKADANKWLKIIYKRWVSDEKGAGCSDNDISSFKEFIEDNTVKVKKVKVRTDAKTERIILQSK